MILNKDTITVYRQEAWGDGITSYNATPVFTWLGKLQPASDIIEWSFDWMSAFHVYNIYTEYMGIQIWDKIDVGWESYYVKWVEYFTWILRDHTKALVNTEYDN